MPLTACGGLCRISAVKVPSLFSRLAFLASLNLLAIGELVAQSPDDKTSLSVTFPNGEKVKLRGREGRFATIGIGPGETVDLRLDLPARFANVPLVVQALDGGSVTPEEFFGGKAQVSAQYRAGSQPGLYRILLNGGGGTALLRFWVPNPENPAADPPVITPKSQEVAR